MEEKEPLSADQSAGADAGAVGCCEDGGACDQLPEEIVQKILSRLPLPSVAHFAAASHRCQALAAARECGLAWLNARLSQPWLFLWASRWTKRDCCAYDFVSELWHRLPLDYLPHSYGAYFQSSHLGHVLLDLKLTPSIKWNSHYRWWPLVFNPITKRQVAVVPSGAHSLPFREATGLVLDKSTDTFKIVIVATNNAAGPALAYVYRSDLKKWTSGAHLPAASMHSAQTEMTLCNSKLYCISAEPGLLLAYDVAEDKWSTIRMPIRNPVQFWASLVACGDRLFLVWAPIGRCDYVTIWQLDEATSGWVKEEAMPYPLCKEILKTAGCRLECVGVGHRICFRAHNTLEVLSFDVLSRLWRWLPATPSGFSWDSPNRLSVKGFQFEPSLAHLPLLA